jgi:hypothetical protein
LYCTPIRELLRRQKPHYGDDDEDDSESKASRQQDAFKKTAKELLEIEGESIENY